MVRWISKTKFGFIMLRQFMWNIILLKLLLHDLRQPAPNPSDMLIRALSYEDYVPYKKPRMVEGRLNKFYVQRRFLSLTATSLLKKV